MKVFRPLILSLVSMFALSSCGILKCDRCAAKQEAARQRAIQEYHAAQQGATVSAPAPAPTPAATNQQGTITEPTGSVQPPLANQ